MPLLVNSQIIESLSYFVMNKNRTIMAKNPNWQPRTWRVVPLGPPGHFASQSSYFASHHQFSTRHGTMKVVIVLLATVAAVSAVKISNCGKTMFDYNLFF